jgi:hypothetical protein
MRTAAWVALHAANALFWLWVACWGGAERLEGTFASGWLVSVFAPNWSAEGLKLFAWIMLVAGGIWFIVGLVEPGVRLFF